MPVSWDRHKARPKKKLTGDRPFGIGRFYYQTSATVARANALARPPGADVVVVDLQLLLVIASGLGGFGGLVGALG